MAVGGGHPPFAIDQGVVAGRCAPRLGDPWKPVVEQGAAAAPHLDALALLAGEDPEAVVFHLMQPAWPGGRDADEGRLTGLEETGRRGAPQTRRMGMPQHASM